MSIGALGRFPRRRPLQSADGEPIEPVAVLLSCYLSWFEAPVLLRGNGGSGSRSSRTGCQARATEDFAGNYCWFLREKPTIVSREILRRDRQRTVGYTEQGGFTRVASEALRR